VPASFHMDGDIGVLTLASPERRNALSSELVASALDILAGSEAAKARALVITGAGSAFCAGADIGDLLNAGWLGTTPKPPTPIELFEAIARDPRIFVGAVNGLAFGGGFELMLTCDLAVASQGALFCLPELEHGVIPNSGLARLPQLVGQRIAFEMIATGRKISAHEAAERGLVNLVVPPKLLLEAAIGLAKAIIRRAPPGALAAAKSGIRRHAPVDWDEIRTSLQRLPSAEWEEGLNAFLERRRPDYEPFWRDYAQRKTIQDV
jgi:enoyl-CoA hydratase/carnithine racemase